MSKRTFSKREGFYSAEAKEISVREDAPEGLRGFIKMLFYDLNKYPSDLRKITTRVLKLPPDPNNWSEYPNIDFEVSDHLYTCKWFRVYDIIESIFQTLNAQEKQTFSEEINEFFVNNGIGWKLVDGLIQTRGDEVFETAVKSVTTVLDSAKLRTAKAEIAEALRDLSRRPEPDITGAIQHSMACLECVAREFTGDKKATLGDIIKRNPNLVPRPLDSALEKIWGFTSEQGRHLREGDSPEYLEAELVVELSAAISTYLAKKLNSKGSKSELDDLPF